MAERRTYAQRVDDAETALLQAAARRLGYGLRALDGLERTLTLLSPTARLNRQTERLADAVGRLTPALQRLLREREADLSAGLAALMRHGGPNGLEQRRRALDELVPRLDSAGRTRLDRAGREAERRRTAAAPGALRLDRAEHSLERLALRLAGLDPAAPLERGYALVHGRDGRLVRSVDDVAVDENVSLEVRNGSIAAASPASPPRPLPIPRRTHPARRAKSRHVPCFLFSLRRPGRVLRRAVALTLALAAVQSAAWAAPRWDAPAEVSRAGPSWSVPRTRNPSRLPSSGGTKPFLWP